MKMQSAKYVVCWIFVGRVIEGNLLNVWDVEGHQTLGLYCGVDWHLAFLALTSGPNLMSHLLFWLSVCCGNGSD